MSWMRTLGGVGVVSVVGFSMEDVLRKPMRRIAVAVIALALLPPLGADAQEVEVSANAGWVSQYFYRGILQKTSSASAGVDVGIGAASFGTWLADVGDGAEIDLFGAVGGEVGGGVSLSAGGTAYLYTSKLDDTYVEANLGAGYGPLNLEVSFGQYENFGAGTLGHVFVGVTAEHEGFYGTVGGFAGDFSGNYGEVGYGFSAAEFDFTISGIVKRFGSFRPARRKRGADARRHPSVRCRQDVQYQVTNIRHRYEAPVALRTVCKTIHPLILESSRPLF